MSLRGQKAESLSPMIPGSWVAEGPGAGKEEGNICGGPLRARHERELWGGASRPSARVGGHPEALPLPGCASSLVLGDLRAGSVAAAGRSEALKQDGRVSCGGVMWLIPLETVSPK